MKAAPIRILIALLLFGWSISDAVADQVRLKATWIKPDNEWLLRIQLTTMNGVLLSKRLIDPNSRALTDKRMIRLVDQATGAPVEFEIKSFPQGEKLESFDLVPRVRGPKGISITINGLVLEDLRGQRLGYMNTMVAIPPPTAADRRGLVAEQTPPPDVMEHPPRRPPNATPPPPPLPPPPPTAMAFPSPGRRPQPTPTPRGQRAKPPAVTPYAIAPQPSPSPTPPGPKAKSREAPPENYEIPESAPSTEMPSFPFPPPKASARLVIPRQLLIADQPDPHLRDVKDRLDRAFNECGYGERTFYQVPEGFAMASQIEQIREDGSPTKKFRWLEKVSVMDEFSLRSYMRALFTAVPGNYRVIVFIVTSRPLNSQENAPSYKDATGFVEKGSPTLSEDIGDLEFTHAHECTAMIYQFRKVQGGEPIFVRPSQITGQIHLDRAGLLSALARQ